MVDRQADDRQIVCRILFRAPRLLYCPLVTQRLGATQNRGCPVWFGRGKGDVDSLDNFREALARQARKDVRAIESSIDSALEKRQDVFRRAADLHQQLAAQPLDDRIVGPCPASQTKIVLE